MRIAKGQYGYIRSQKLVRLWRTIICFALPLAFFIFGLIINHGDRASIYSVIALVGCIPGCMSAVNMIVMWIRKPMDRDLYDEISAKAKDLCVVYELYLTTYEKNLFLDATAIAGDYIACYTTEEARHSDIVKMEEHIVKTIRANGYKVTVKIFDQKKAFLDRMAQMLEKKGEYEAQAMAHFKPYDKYPDLTKTELLKHFMMALAL